MQTDSIRLPLAEPFEANFVLDVAERALRDMLAVTKEFQDPTVKVPEYQPLQRKVGCPIVDGCLA